MGLFKKKNRKKRLRKFFKNLPILRNIGLSIRSEDIALAKSMKRHDVFLDKPRTAKEIIAHAHKVAKAEGVGISKKSSKLGKWSKLSTTYPTEIRVGANFDKLHPTEQAITLMHELRHARQWRDIGVKNFARGYVTDPRFGWIMEVEAYGESVWTAVCMGGADEPWLTKYVHNRDDSLIRSYLLLRPLKQTHLRKRTDEIMEWVLEKAKKVISENSH